MTRHAAKVRYCSRLMLAPGFQVMAGFFCHPCLPNPCLGGGTCSNLAPRVGFSCACPAGYAGSFCQLPSSSICPKNSTAFNLPGAAADGGKQSAASHACVPFALAPHRDVETCVLEKTWKQITKELKDDDGDESAPGAPALMASSGGLGKLTVSCCLGWWFVGHVPPPGPAASLYG